MPIEILQVAQRVENLERASAFYAQILGAAPITRPNEPGRVFFNIGMTRLLLDAEAPSARLVLLVDDVRSTIEQLRRQGVDVVREPYVTDSFDDDVLAPADTDEVVAYVHDSEGNLLGLGSHEARHTP